MPKTNAPVFKTFCQFEFDEESAAAVYLLRGCSKKEFNKYCHDGQQYGACTSVGSMFLSMFRALQGKITKTGELPEEGSNGKRLQAAYSLGKKAGRPSREVALKKDAGILLAEALQAPHPTEPHPTPTSPHIYRRYIRPHKNGVTCDPGNFYYIGQ